ncbi:MAG: phosphotransferase [Caldilineaceae bacterium]
MNEQIRKHRAEMQRQAVPVIEQFVQDHPQYSIDADQAGSQSVTNYVIFGHHGPERVIFKYFCRDERKQREVFALRHFADTGIVPKLLEEEGSRLIVESHIPGSFLPREEYDPTAFLAVDRDKMGRTLGEAVAKLTSTPLSIASAEEFESRFYNGERLPDYFETILQASRQIHQQVDCYKDEIFAFSLAQIEGHLPFILAQPRLLYHQDALNIHFVESTFSGFFDLEMCRVGCAAMQIGSLWYVINSYRVWEPFSEGFARVAGRRLTAQDKSAALAFAHFMLWRSISDYGDWHGEELGQDAMAEVITQAETYRKTIDTMKQGEG